MGGKMNYIETPTQESYDHAIKALEKLGRIKNGKIIKEEL
jgi:hypothetical protein